MHYQHIGPEGVRCPEATLKSRALKEASDFIERSFPLENVAFAGGHLSPKGPNVSIWRRENSSEEEIQKRPSIGKVLIVGDRPV